jgi:Sugar-transfer associated ATP-grasp
MVLPDLQIAEALGGRARRLFTSAKLMGTPRHPPTRAIYFASGRTFIIAVTVLCLAAYAGKSLKNAVHIPVHRQIMDMTHLWFRRGIDPPSYYALELWRANRSHDSDSYLTRFETKNGLFTRLNNRLPKSHTGNEMSDKLLFARMCRDSSIRQAGALLHVTPRSATRFCAAEALDVDLFVKPQNGMGAEGTFVIRSNGPASHVMPDGTILSRESLMARLKTCANRKPLLVQALLRNHAALADLADQSLLTVRVITCLNEAGAPEACMAMLRLISKLEPRWKARLSDGEYASPIDMQTGLLGDMTGDSMRTSHRRFMHHPVTKAAIPGRQMPLWAETCALAVAAHRAFSHRAVIGWDIAVTPDGPVVLEGNTNFDVMFLQRVMDVPIGRSRLGELLDHQMQLLANSIQHEVGQDGSASYGGRG